MAAPLRTSSGNSDADFVSQQRQSHAREVLRGYPAEVQTAMATYFSTGSGEELDRLLRAVLEFHLRPPADTGPRTPWPPGARLVEDLRLDSLAMVELVFLLHDLLGVKIPDGELRELRTLSDLQMAVRRQCGMLAKG